MRQATEIQSHASDIRQTALLIEGVLVTLMFDNDNFKATATETELEAISEKLWAIKTRLEEKSNGDREKALRFLAMMNETSTQRES